MSRHLFKFVNNLKLRWKLLVVVLPLVVGPIIVVGSVVGYISSQQAHLGITRASMDDLEHMTAFTLDLLDAHHQQYQVYQQDKRESFTQDLAAMTNIAYSLVESAQRQRRGDRTSLAEAKAEANKALKRVSVGESGYLYAMTSRGDLEVHVAREGENIFDEQDEEGRYFIRELCAQALASTSDQVLFTVYPWSNEMLGERRPRLKIAAFRYFKEWDWIIAASGYLDETYGDTHFERRAFEELKGKLKTKKVGKTGYIYALDSQGNFTLHPEGESQNFLAIRDAAGHAFISEMVEKKNGWIRYPWRNSEESAARMKIVRYAYFAPWDWIVAVGSYEDEFYREANAIKGRTFASMLLLTLLASVFSIGMILLASKVLTDPIRHMIEVIRKVKQGRLDEQMMVEGRDELSELAATFNRMTGIIRRNQEMETALAQQGKMASLGILSSGVAHEINNPLGVILGYASYLEGKIPTDDPHYGYINEIKRESKRCKKIVQDLLSFARTPKPSLTPTDINLLLGQILDFATNHTDMHHVSIIRDLAADLPQISADGDQLRQVAINLILNAGAAMEKGGRLLVSTAFDAEQQRVQIAFADNGAGIAEEHLDRIFEPFFTTKARGTGLGLAITKQIIDQHHGRIELESTLGQGTAVRIWLPVAQEIL
jgi:two-component system, NtrC family, sensor kinase